LAQPRRQKPVEAAKHLEASGLTSKQLSSVHHFSLNGRDVTYAEAYRYFSAPKELQGRNADYENRLVFIAGQYKAKAGTFPQLINTALRKWPLS
jgi:hypothetical protein